MVAAAKVSNLIVHERSNSNMAAVTVNGTPRARVAIVGAGVSGLSTAYCILTTMKECDVEVTIIAEKFSPGITSDYAAAIVIPLSILGTKDFDPDSDNKAKISEWFLSTQRHLMQVFASPETGEAGVSLVPGYVLFALPEPEPSHKEGFVGFSTVSQTELKELGLPPCPTAWKMSAFVVECSKYLPWLTRKIQNCGATLKKEKVSSFAPLLQEYDVVINCTGLGARELVPDRSLTPILGHAIALHAPWVKYFTFIEDTSNSYYTLVCPRAEEVYVGGCMLPGKDVKDLTPDITAKVMKRVTAMFPNLKGARVLDTYTAARPGRKHIRLELEHVGDQAVIHNYGHGGNGINCHWGCAEEVVTLLREALSLRPTTYAKL